MTFATDFANALNDKFQNESISIDVQPGRKYDKLIAVDSFNSRSVFGFIDKNTGDLYKPASWKVPAKNVRYYGDEVMTQALEDADVYGRFLYSK